MNKSILVIDTPETCTDCPLKNFDLCWSPRKRNNPCPLKPLPKEKHGDEHDEIKMAIAYGWNSCLAALEGKDMVDKLIEHANRILAK